MPRPIIQIIGQVKARRLLDIAAASRSSVLLVGAPGHGKTLLAVTYLTRFGKPLLLGGYQPIMRLMQEISLTNRPTFIDEVHRLPGAEFLYPYIDKPASFWSPRRVFAMATTDQGELPGPLVSRLILVALEKYTLDELSVIASSVARLDPRASRVVAECSHGSPRRAKMLAQIVATGGYHDAGEKLASVGYENGINGQEREYLHLLENGPKSVTTLAGLLGVGIKTVRTIENDLIAAGLVEITSKGRVLRQSPSQPAPSIVSSTSHFSVDLNALNKELKRNLG